VDDKSDCRVFLKETVNPPVQRSVVDDRRFLAEARHAFLIRRPEEIAASWFALEHDMRIHDTGVRLLHDLFVAVQNAGGHPPVVIDSQDLVANPAATMAAYCAAVELPFVADALRWQPGQRSEWARSSRWHEDAATSRGFEAPAGADRHGLATHPQVARFAARHSPFYEELRRHRLTPSAIMTAGTYFPTASGDGSNGATGTRIDGASVPPSTSNTLPVTHDDASETR
jgi:hypothetical protein